MNGCGCGKPMCKPSTTAAMSMTRCRVPVTETQRHDTQAEIHVCMEKGTPGRHAHNDLARAAAGTPVRDVAQIPVNNSLRLAQSRNRVYPGMSIPSQVLRNSRRDALGIAPVAWLWGTGMRSQSGCIPHWDPQGGTGIALPICLSRIWATSLTGAPAAALARSL